MKIKHLLSFLRGLFITFLLAIGLSGVSYSEINSTQAGENQTSGHKAKAPQKIPRSSAISDYLVSPRGSRGDAWCLYDGDTGNCTRCSGNPKEDCSSTNESSASACMAHPICRGDGFQGGVDAFVAPTISQEAVCYLNRSQNTCQTISVDKKTGKISEVGISIPQGSAGTEACGHHCASNGVE